MTLQRKGTDSDSLATLLFLLSALGAGLIAAISGLTGSLTGPFALIAAGLLALALLTVTSP